MQFTADVRQLYDQFPMGRFTIQAAMNLEKINALFVGPAGASKDAVFAKLRDYLTGEHFFRKVTDHGNLGLHCRSRKCTCHSVDG